MGPYILGQYVRTHARAPRTDVSPESIPGACVPCTQCYMRTLQFLNFYQSVGVLIIVVGDMINDVAIWTILGSVVSFGLCESRPSRARKASSVVLRAAHSALLH